MDVRTLERLVSRRGVGPAAVAPAVRRGLGHGARLTAAGGRLRRRPGRRGADPVAAAREGGRQVRRVRRRHDLHGRRARAGHPPGGRRPARPALPHRRGAPRVRPRLRHRRRRDGARRARPAGQGHRRRRGDGRGGRGQPAALAGRDHGGRARGGPAPAHRGGRPAHRRVAGPGAPYPRGGRRPRADPAGLQPRGDLAVVDHGAAHRPRPAGDRRQAQPVLPARRGAARRGGAVDVVRR